MRSRESENCPQTAVKMGERLLSRYLAGELLAGHRLVIVTGQKTKKDWACFIEEIAEA